MEGSALQAKKRSTLRGIDARGYVPGRNSEMVYGSDAKDKDLAGVDGFTFGLFLCFCCVYVPFLAFPLLATTYMFFHSRLKRSRPATWFPPLSFTVYLTRKATEQVAFAGSFTHGTARPVRSSLFTNIGERPLGDTVRLVRISPDACAAFITKTGRRHFVRYVFSFWRQCGKWPRVKPVTENRTRALT